MLTMFMAIPVKLSPVSLVYSVPGSQIALVLGALALVGSLHGGAGFVDCALGVVVALDGEAVLVDGAVALAGAVEDAGQLDVAPDLDPLGVAVAAESVAEGVGGR